MKKLFMKAMCAVLAAVTVIMPYISFAYTDIGGAYLKSIVIDKTNSTVQVSCKFPSGQENRIATVILAKAEIAPNEAIDLTNGKIENIMLTPVDYNGNMSLTVGYDANEKEYILYVICDDSRLTKRINLAEHLVSFNLSNEYGALNSDTAKGRLEERLNELPDEVSVAAPVSVSNSLEIYVSDFHGDDNNSGNKENPLKTLGKALEKLSEAKSTGTIVLRGGVYKLSDTININETHTGGKSIDDVTMIKGYPGESVYFETNPRMSADDFEEIDEDTAKLIIDETAGSKILKATVPEAYKAIAPTKLKVYINGNEMTQARWPNSSEVRMGEVTYDKEDGWTTKYITLFKERLDRWDFEKRNIYFNGCFNNAEYAPAVTLVRNYDKTTGEITTGSSWSGNANPDGADALHFYCNVLEEIDVPGEWCVDKNNVLYIYPTENFENSEIVLGTTGDASVENMIKISNAKGLVFDNINFRYAKNAVFASDCEDIIFQNCVFDSISDRAVVFEKCKYSGVISSEITNIGKVGVEFTYDDDGEDVFGATLADKNFSDIVPSRNFVQNSVINGVGGADDTGAIVDRWGIGDIFSHNVIGNVENNGFYFVGPMEHIVEYNEIFSFAQDISDSGGVYFGMLRARGNMIRYNYIHDPLKGGVGVYFDSMSGGNYAYGNVIKNCLVAFSTNGGRDNAFAGNIVVNDVEKFEDLNKDIKAIYNNPWLYHPAGDPYWDTTLVPHAERVMSSDIYTSPAIAQRYTEWITQLRQIQDYLAEKEELGEAYARGNVRDKTDKQNIARGLSGNYIGNNIVVGTDNHMEELLTQTHVDNNGYNHGIYCYMWGIDGFCDENGSTENVNTNVTYNDANSVGFNNYAADDFTLKSDAEIFSINSEFKNLPFEKMGIRNGKPSLTELEFYGANYGVESDGNAACNISWKKVNGAEEYKITVSDDENFANVLTTDSVRNPMYTYEGKLYARPYYVKIEYTTTSKLYSSKSKTAYGVFKPDISEFSVTDKSETSDTVSFKLKNNTGKDISPNIYIAQYEGGSLKSCDVILEKLINKDGNADIDVILQENCTVKLFVWDKMLKNNVNAIKLK